MPRGDGTGPSGMGPMTGRAAGFCAGYPVPGYANPMPGRGFYGRGRGGGRGRRNWFYATGLPGWARAPYGYPAWGATPAVAPAYPAPWPAEPTAEQELAALKQQSEYLRSSLDQIQERIEELQATKADKG